MVKTDKRLARLPAWARNEIARLKADLKDAKNDFAMAVGTTKTRIEVGPYNESLGRARHFVAENDTIRFRLKGGYIDAKLVDDGAIEIRTQDAIVVYPNSANSIDVSNQKFIP